MVGKSPEFRGSFVGKPTSYASFHHTPPLNPNLSTFLFPGPHIIWGSSAGKNRGWARITPAREERHCDRDLLLWFLLNRFSEFWTCQSRHEIDSGSRLTGGSTIFLAGPAQYALEILSLRLLLVRFSRGDLRYRHATWHDAGEGATAYCADLAGQHHLRWPWACPRSCSLKACPTPTPTLTTIQETNRSKRKLCKPGRSYVCGRTKP